MGVIETAKKYIGKVKYIFGADNLDGGKADCSSFTQTVFAKNGIIIGRDTDAQWRGGSEVSKEDLQAGDLVFFANTYNSDNLDGVSHVGIALGDGSFIHNSSISGVTISKLSNSYWESHYLGAKRYGGSEGTSEGSSSSDSSELKTKWWGDGLIIVICTMLIIGGLAMLALSVKNNILS